MPAYIEAFLAAGKKRGIPEAPQSFYDGAGWTIHFISQAPTLSTGDGPPQPDPPQSTSTAANDRRWTAEETKAWLAERAAEREPEPEPWRALPGAQYLFDVLEEDHRPRRASRLICRWFIDNPMGSTSCRLSLLGAAARTFGLHFEVHHLEFPESLLFAELPRTVATDPAQLFEVLQALFARNGAEDQGHYLLRCPPHGVWNGDVFDVNAVKTLFSTSREVADYVLDPEKWWEEVFVANDSSATA